MIRFTGEYELPYNDRTGYYESRRAKDFIHPGCGGLWAESMDIRMSWRIQTFRFLPDGRRSHEIDV